MLFTGREDKEFQYDSADEYHRNQSLVQIVILQVKRVAKNKNEECLSQSSIHLTSL